MSHNTKLNEKKVVEFKKISFFDAANGLPCNQTVIDNFTRACSIINRPAYKNIIATISGGSDSDLVLDILSRVDKNQKVKYVWVNTGLEYQATKDHLKYLEERYGITFERVRPKKPIPTAVREYGQPFLSKRVSDYISRLQKHNFTFVDGDFEDLYKQYPKCKSALQWWCNMNKSNTYNVRNNKLLKEFLIENPPTFKISNKCCHYAKKSIIKKILKDYDADLNVFGVRKAEGGARATAYKSCFGTKNTKHGSYDEYRPVWWYKNADKEDYCKACSITHSKCYTEYGLPRTGCCGCPFGKDFEHELEVAKKYEPNLYKAAMFLFKDSYDYTRAYKDFVKAHAKEDEKEDKADKNHFFGKFIQMSIFDFLTA